MAKFSVEYRVRGSVSEIIEADSEAEAKDIANSKAYDENWEPDLDSVDDVDVYVQEMHRVVRDGRPLWTTYVRPTDELSQPATNPSLPS